MAIKCPVVGTPTSHLMPREDAREELTRRNKAVIAPATRPVYINDIRAQAAFAIAQKIAGLRLQIKALEQEYRKVSGTYSDPSIDLRQLQFDFAHRFVTVHGA